MNTRYLRSLTSSRPQGLTLLEVLAGLTLLATLLVATILSYGAHTRQVRAAQKRLQAIELLDRLLVKWYEAGEVPGRDEGLVEEIPGWRWRAAQLPSDDLKSFKSHRIRVEIFDSAEAVESHSLAFVEVLRADTEEVVNAVTSRE